MPPLHLLVMAAIFLPGQSLTRTLQLDYLLTLDPGAAGSVHLYSSVFGTVSRQDRGRQAAIPANINIKSDLKIA